MSQTSKPRRPASLSAAKADQIDAGGDPSLRHQLAHETAAALVHGARNSADPEVVHRLVNLVTDQGIEEVALLWEAAPARTLPGALWRLYLVHTWVTRDPGGVFERYDLGRHSAPALQLLAGVATPPTPDEVARTINAILTGAFTADFGVALRRTAAFVRLVAYGSGHSADAALDAQDAASLTQRGGSLLTLADHLDGAAALWDAGFLD